MTSSPEYLLLQQAIQLGAPVRALQEAQRLVVEEPIDWTAWSNLAAGHSIQPQAAALLRQLPVALVPTNVVAQLNETNRSIAMLQMAYAGEFLQIQKLLQSENITAVPYKGFWLGHSAYGSIAEREGGDVDLFIAPQDLVKVQQIMYKRGYLTETGSLGDDAQGILQFNGEYNFDKFFEEERIFLIEYHSSISHQKLGLNVQLADLQDQIQLQLFQGQTISVFSPTAQLFLVVLHHGAKDGWGKLKQVLDIGKLLQSSTDQLDWPWLMQINQRYDTTRLFLVGLGLAQTLTGVNLPEPIQQELKQASVQNLIHNRVKALAKRPVPAEKGYRVYAARLWFFWKTRYKWTNRWALILNHLKPTPIFEQKLPDKGIKSWLIVRFLSRIPKIVLLALKEKNQ